jgi:hypothetical protein
MIIEFEVKKKKYKIDGLTIEDWYHIQDELALNPHAALSVTSYLSGCPADDLKELKVEAWDLLWENVQEFIKYNQTPSQTNSKVIKFGGESYELLNFEDISIGEFADLDITVSSAGADKKLHEVCAILLRQRIDGELEPYDIQKTKKRAEVLKLLPLREATRITSFFLFLGLQYLDNTVGYLKSLIKQETIPEQKETLQTTLKLLLEAGTKLLSSLPTNPSSKSNLSQNSESKPASTGWLILKTKSGSKNLNYKKLFPNISAN